MATTAPQPGIGFTVWLPQAARWSRRPHMVENGTYGSTLYVFTDNGIAPAKDPQMKPLHVDSSIPGAASASPRLEGRISMADNTRYLPAIGRILVGGIFAMSGLTKGFAYAATIAAITAAGLPLAPVDRS